MHWSGGGIGYFPTYALGNVISLQIWAKVREALPDLDDQMAAGDLLELSDWLRDNLYAWGRKLTPKETLGRLTGSDAIDPQPYLAYLGDKMAAARSLELGRWSHSSAPRRSWTTSRSACSRRFPPAPSSSTPTRTSATTSTACAAGPTRCSRIFDRVGIDALLHVLPRRARPRAGVHRGERPHARVRRGGPRPDHPVRAPRPRRSGPIEEAKRCLDLGARGIKLHPRAQKFSVGDERLDAVFALAVERDVPILIHGGRGLPPIGDHLAALVERYAGVRLIIAHAGIADLGGLAGHFAHVPGVFFDTSVWSIVDLVDLMRQVAPAADPVRDGLPVRPAAELAPARASRGQAVALRRGRVRAACSARRRRGSRTARRCRALTAPKGPTEITHPLPLARIHALHRDGDAAALDAPARRRAAGSAWRSTPPTRRTSTACRTPT